MTRALDWLHDHGVPLMMAILVIVLIAALAWPALGHEWYSGRGYCTCRTLRGAL